MRKIGQKINTYRHNLTAFLAGMIYAGVGMMTNDPTVGDYNDFLHRWGFNPLFGIQRWFEWSSRLIIESGVNVFARNLYVWGFFNLLFGGLLFWSLSRILGNRRIIQTSVLLMLMLSINSYMMASAGIFATTINYLWPFAAFLFALTTILKPFRNKKINLWANIFSVPAIIFAVCSEQITVLALLVFAGIAIKNIIEKKKVPKLVLFFIILSVVGILNVLISPGNVVRTASEIRNWWPDFQMVSLKQKILNGTIVSFARLFLSPELPAVILVIALAILAFRKGNSKAFVAILPSLGILGLIFAPISTLSSYTSLTTYFVEIRNVAHGMDSGHMGNVRFRMFILTLSAVFTASILLAIYFIYGKTKRTLYILYALMAGVITMMMISFSPTLFGSSTRTMYLFVVILCAVDFVVIQDLIKDRFKLKSRK